MTIRVCYRAQFRTVTRKAEENFPPLANVAELLAEIARRYPPLSALLFHPDRTRRPWALVLVNDQPADDSQPIPANAVVTLLAPMAGG